MTEQRRLAAILVADVVGYSKLIGSDEAGTLAQLQSLLCEIIEPQLAKHAGRLFKAVGDGFLIEFASAVQAVGCAQAIQEANAQGALPLRIGIHVGDVVVQGDDLMGDGVNIAARIEGVADAGGIAISRAVHEQVRDKLDVEFTDKGEIALKNLARPVHLFSLSATRPSASAPTLALPSSIVLLPSQNMRGDPQREHGLDTRQRLSIVVLPFELLGGDPADSYLADGITEDLTSDLSHVPAIFIIARASAFSYRGKVTDVRRIGAELGVRYAVTGSVRRIGATLRVNAQLISTESGVQLWSDRFDQAISDLASGQERIVGRLRSTLAVGLTDIEARRSARERPTNPDAFDLILRARSVRYQPETPDTLAEAVRLFELALQNDPNSIEALTGASNALAESSLVHDTGDALDRAAQYMERARKLDPNAEQVMLAHVTLIRVQERWSELPEAAERFIEAYPNNEMGYNLLAIARIYQGRLEEAIPLLEASMRLHPRNPIIYFREWRMALVMVLLGRHEAAIVWAKRAANPGAPPRWRATSFLIEAAASVQMGDMIAARQSLGEAQRLWPLDTVRTRYVEGPASSAHKAQYALYQDALRLVGHRDHAEPDADYGVPGDDHLHGDLVGLTPTTVPGGRTIVTTELQSLLADQNPLVIDTMLYTWGHSIPGAIGLAGSGRGGALSGSMTERLGRKLEQMTRGDLSVPIVAMGWNSERFDGRNLALRIGTLGYKQVYWYRGGREAWEVADLPVENLAPQDW
jgi:class 3 adenylate cyclase/TolB-like protein